MNLFLNVISPLDQFEVRNLLSLEAPILGYMSIGLTIIALYLTIGGYLIFIIFLSVNIVSIVQGHINRNRLRLENNTRGYRNMLNFITVPGFHGTQRGFFVFEASNTMYFSDPVIWRLRIRLGTETEFIYNGVTYHAVFYTQHISRVEPYIFIPVRVTVITPLTRNYVVFSGDTPLQVLPGRRQTKIRVQIQ